MMLKWAAVRQFIHAAALPDQYGGTYPQIRIVAGDEAPRVITEARSGKPDRRVIVVGREYLARRVADDLDVHCAAVQAAWR